MTADNNTSAIRKLRDATTPGPWDGRDFRAVVAGLATATGNHAADSDFIRTAHCLMPDLCDEIDEAHRQCSRLNRELDDTRAALIGARTQAAIHANTVGVLAGENARLRQQRDAYADVVEAAKVWRAQFEKPADTKLPRMAALIVAVDALPKAVNV